MRDFSKSDSDNLTDSDNLNESSFILITESFFVSSKHPRCVLPRIMLIRTS